MTVPLLLLFVFVSLGFSQDKPNILFVIWDDASYPHQGAYGCSWVKTPAFDSLAQNGILFANAYTPDAKCAPSRSVLITGRNPWQLEAAANHNCIFPKKFKSVFEALGQNGYATGFTGKGVDPVDPGNRRLTGPQYNNKKLNPPTSEISNINYAANFTAFYNGKAKNKPFCFWVGGKEPHRDYAYGSGIAKGGKNLSDITEVPPFWPDTTAVRTDMLDYAFEIEWFDTQVGKIIDFLRSKGDLDNTLVIFTSDNGMPFPRSKGQSYEFPTHMPMAAMWKDRIRNPGRTVTDFVSFIDIAPTFLEAAGMTAEQAGMEPVQGRSLFDIFDGSSTGQVNPVRDHVILGRERNDVGRPGEVGYPIRAIIKNGFMLLVNMKPERWPAGNPECGYPDTDGSPTKTACINARTKPGMHRYWQWSYGLRDTFELYRLSTDRYCIENLVNNAAFASVFDSLRTRLFAELTAQEDPRMLGNGDVFDDYPLSKSNLRNWYVRWKRGDNVSMGWIDKSNLDPDAASDTSRGVVSVKATSSYQGSEALRCLLFRSGDGIIISVEGSDPLREVSLYDVSGRLVARVSGTGGREVRIGRRLLPKSGTYLVRAVSSNGRIFTHAALMF